MDDVARYDFTSMGSDGPALSEGDVVFCSLEKAATVICMCRMGTDGRTLPSPLLV